MSVSYQRTQLAEGISCTSVVDEKFKTNQIRVRFLTPLSSETASANAAAISMLSLCSSRYPTLAALSDRLNELYGANLGFEVAKAGNLQVLSLSVIAIDSRYALDGEDVTAQALELLLDCLFSPCAADGAFAEGMFKIRKKEMLDTIEAEINNKRGYAIQQAGKLAFVGEAAAYSSYGEKQEAQALTAAGAYAAYQRLLCEARVEIYCVGGREMPEAVAALQQRFTALPRKPQAVTFAAPSPCRDTPAEKTVRMDVEQSKLVLVLKYDFDDYAAMQLMNTILGGGSTVSKLFVNVREKLSLCYYCASRLMHTKRAMMIDSGIELAKLDTAKAEILAQIQAICDGNFTEDELDDAGRVLADGLGGVGDTPSGWAGWYFARLTVDDVIAPEMALEQLRTSLLPAHRAKTRERIIAAAKSLRLDTVYLMQQREGN